MGVDSLHFKPLKTQDIDLLINWFKQPHVAQWWQAESKLSAVVIREKYEQKLKIPGQESFIIYSNTHAIGYIQCYDALQCDFDRWSDQPIGTWGIDLFIGEPSLVGKGLGSAIIKKFKAQLFACPGVTKVIADPDAANIRAIRCFEKADFINSGNRTTPDGLVVLMEFSKS